jgi:hypothetical protein
MAKKKKQKKAGLVKRQLSRLQKKSAQKRREQAQKPVQKKVSTARIKQNLKNLPSLLFEPELKNMAFSTDAVRQAIAAHDKIPDQIDALATEDFLQQLKERHIELKARFDREGDPNKSMMAYAIIHFMEQENAPACLNQIVVAMFYQALAEIEQPGTPLTLKDLNRYLREYDKTWEAYLQEKAGQMNEMTVMADADTIAQQYADEADSASATSQSPFEPLLDDFREQLSSLPSMTETSIERTIEDVEVLLIDYCDEKAIRQLSELDGRKIKRFLEGWFVRNMNPTREDMETMLIALDQFYDFATSAHLLPEEISREIKYLLSNRDPFLAVLET